MAGGAGKALRIGQLNDMAGGAGKALRIVRHFPTNHGKDTTLPIGLSDDFRTVFNNHS